MFRPRLRSVVLLVVLLTVLGGAAPALGQEATPAADGDRLFADLGLPELTVTATDAGFALSESEVPAGRYLVTVINESSAPEAIAIFARLGDGMTLDDLSFADELAAGTPMPEEGPPPESYMWIFEAYMPGGTIATPDAPSQVVVDLRGGDYGVLTIDPIPAAALAVTGDRRGGGRRRRLPIHRQRRGTSRAADHRGAQCQRPAARGRWRTVSRSAHDGADPGLVHVRPIERGHAAA
jgi:hypothetical protein